MSDDLDEEQQRILDEKIQLKKKKSGRPSRKGVSAEVFGAYNKKEEYEPPVIEKDEKTKEAICELVKKSVLMGFLRDSEIKILIDAMTV